MAKKFQVVTVGSAVSDLFVLTNEGQLLPGTGADCEKLIAFEYGAKIPVGRIQEEIGGAGINIAGGLNRLGVKAAPCVAVGEDELGDKTRKKLKEYEIDTSLLQVIPESESGRSVILVEPKDRDRTIFYSREAGNHLKIDSLFECKMDWVFVSSLPEGWEGKLDKVLKLKRHEEIEIAFNPGRRQLKAGISKLAPFLREVSILFVNWDEALELSFDDKGFRQKYSGKTPPKKAVLSFIKSLGPGMVVVTLGRKGSLATDGYYYYKAPCLSPKRVELTGAGDAFTSGFLASWINERGNVKRAMGWGSANAGNVVLYFGAHKGLLSLGQIKKKINEVLVNNLIEESPL